MNTNSIFWMVFSLHLQGFLLGKRASVIHLNHDMVGFQFKTCSHTGPLGPTQQQCDAAYKTTKNKVKVWQDDGLAGVQVWTVPESNTYSITALGASGGTGVRNHNHAKGAYAHAVFNLTEGEQIYMLVGQQGESACSPSNMRKDHTGEVCRHWAPNATKDDDIGQNIVGGGGGGGGGTFVFKRDPESGELFPLIIAGGGGGKSFNYGQDYVRSNGGMSNSGPGTSASTSPNGPGGGGGWQGRHQYRQSGFSLLEGAAGGAPCPDATSNQGSWETSGGFGGGGGSCTAGGGGGGYTGGNASLTDNPMHNGQGGSAYISPGGMQARIEPGVHDDDGEVEISLLLDCPCEFLCVYKDYEAKDFTCFCAVNSILAEDGLSCIDSRDLELKANKTLVKAREKDPPTGAMIAAVAGGVVFIVALIATIFCIVQKYKNKKQLKIVRLERLTYTDHPLDRLRAAAAGGQGMTEYNPNYDFGGSKCTLQDLRELNRDNLVLVRALGQGAFGEVYQGYLSNVTRESSELAVAIKTLPALCTDQAEMDFLMEALIMSKFNHPNIVRFIGVCFEKHPRFIVLELLEGGDLKTFLRESRPKPENPSRVTMIDLVKLSLDISKGCQYLEENHFIHRDIAARNCLLTAKGAGRIAKIADFGMARDIYRADYYRKGGKAMLPVKWMPPEAFLDGIFTSKTDIWSFGILLWEVFSLGYMPYPGRGNQEVMQLVTAGGRLEPPQKCPPPLYHIMTMCWHGISERRPTFATIIHQLQVALQHPEVIHSPLPVFQRPVTMEHDNAVMRPRDPEHMVLTVEPPVKRMEPDSPLSTDQLIRPHSPDIIINNSRDQEKRPNLSCSAESLDKLLHSQNENDPSSSDMFKYPASRSKSAQPTWFKDYSASDQTGEQQPSKDWPRQLSSLDSAATDSGQSSMGSVAGSSSPPTSHLAAASGRDNNRPDSVSSAPAVTTATAAATSNKDQGVPEKSVYENLTSLGARRPPSSTRSSQQHNPFHSQTMCDNLKSGLTSGRNGAVPAMSLGAIPATEDNGEKDDSGVVVDLNGGSSLRQDKQEGKWL